MPEPPIDPPDDDDEPPTFCGGCGLPIEPNGCECVRLRVPIPLTEDA